MSPLPLPLGPLCRCARGAGSSASRAGRGRRVRSLPARAGTPPRGLPPAPPAPPRARRPQPPRELSAGPPGQWGEGGRESSELAPAPQFPPGLCAVGASLLPRPRAPLGDTRPASFLPSALVPPPPARSPAAPRFPFTLSAVYCLSPPPRLAFGLGISSLFITYFDPASLCPRFLRKFYCPRSRVFD